MKILHLSDDGLPDWRVEKAATSAHNQGHEVMFGGGVSKKSRENIFSKVYEIGWTAKARMGLPFHWNTVKKRIENVIREARPDIVHTHNIFSAKMACELKIPFVYDDHEYWSKHSIIRIEINKTFSENKPRHGWKKILDLYSRIKNTQSDKRIIRVWSNWEKEIVSNHPTITVSEKIANEHSAGKKTKNVFVVQNFPTLSEVRGIQPPKFYDKLSSVYAGNDGRVMGKIPNRNIEGLADLFEREEIGNISFLGWDDKSSEKVRYLGLLPRDRMYEEMQKHSVGLLPWKKHWSHYFLNPNKAYEYAHAGLLVLCTSDLKTISDTLKENCVIFDDYQDLVSKLKYYGKNIDEIYKMRKSAFEFARRNLIWENNEKNIFSAYQLS